MCKIETTKGTQAEGASPALSGRSEMCSQVGEGIRERRAPSTPGLCSCKKMFVFWQNGGAFWFPSSTVPAPPSQSASPCKPGTTKKACLLETGSPFLHLLPSSYLWDEAPGCRPVKERDCPWQLIVRGNRACDFAFKFNHTHRQHPGSMRGFHGDRMQAMTSVNVIRALGLVCETGLISPSVEALWSRPYIGFICWQTTCYLQQGSSASELLPPTSEQAAGRKRSLGTGTAVISIPGIPAQSPQEVQLALIWGTAVEWSNKSQTRHSEDGLRFSSLPCHQQCDLEQVIQPPSFNISTKGEKMTGEEKVEDFQHPQEKMLQNYT